MANQLNNRSSTALDTNAIALNSTQSLRIRQGYNQAPFPTSNPYINGILWGGKRLNLGQNRTISYSFWQPGSESFDDQYGNACTTAYQWLSHETAAVETVLKNWSNVADISFVRTADNNASATLGFYSPKKEQLDPSGIVLGQAGPPSYSFSGIVYLPWNWGPNGTWDFGLQPGGGAFATILHEVGHALGLAHPHDNGGGSWVFPGVTPGDDTDTGDNNLNQGIWTTMSYNSGWKTRDNLSDFSDYGLQSTPMALDIAAIQMLYGRNNRYRTGNDTYTLPANNGKLTAYSCLWDAGGIDTISTGNTSKGAYIDLRPAPLVGANAGGYVSQVNGVAGGFTIANGVTIENATSSSGNDILVGNTANNSLTSAAGNDLVFADAGNDTLLGGTGNDALLSGDGNDILFGQVLPGQNEFDSLTGGGGVDLYVLGSSLGVFYQGSGYATIQDWNATDDYIQVRGASDRYKLEFSNVIGGSALDTKILLGNDTIGIIKDNTNISLSRDFLSA